MGGAKAGQRVFRLSYTPPLPRPNSADSRLCPALSGSAPRLYLCPAPFIGRGRGGKTSKRPQKAFQASQLVPQRRLETVTCVTCTGRAGHHNQTMKEHRMSCIPYEGYEEHEGWNLPPLAERLTVNHTNEEDEVDD